MAKAKQRDMGRTDIAVDAGPGVSEEAIVSASPISGVLLTCPVRGPLTIATLAKDGLTPTEEARRIDFLHYLIGRGYPTDHISVETIVLTGLGENGRNKLRADVIVYDTPVNSVGTSRGASLDHALLVAEIKRESKNKDKGLAFQLEPAMRQLPSMNVLGVYWDDVNRILLHKSLKGEGASASVLVQQDTLANLPPFGQAYRSKPLTLGALLPAENLVATLQNLANAMRSHGVNDDQLRYKETVKLLLARYVDERVAKGRADKVLDLQVFEGGDPTFAKRVGDVYRSAATRYSRAASLFNPQAESELSEAVLRDCIKAIQGVNLSSAPNDVMQQVFMSFVPTVFKKSLDQYFTPITLIEAMVEMTQIGPTDKIADPAMGTADFLTAAMTLRANTGDDDAFQRVYGVDKDDKAFDLAIINMILNRDGQANLLRDDSLEKHSLWAEEMNVVLCNPPFGARTVENRVAVLRHYDLGHVWVPAGSGRWKKTGTIAASQQLGLLFLERCYKMLAPGGRLAIIVPEGYLCTASYGYVRQWLLESFQILSLVELPRRIFLKSDADLRSNVLVARKLPKFGLPDTDYPIHTDLVRKVGYKLGKGFTEIAKRDTDTGLELRNASNEVILDTDFTRVRSGFLKFMSETNDASLLPPVWEGARFSDITSDQGLDMKPRRLAPKALANLRDIRAGAHVRLGDIATVMERTVNILEPPIGPSEKRRLVEGMDIRAIEGTVFPQEPQRCWSIASRKSSAMFALKDRDIVVGLVRPERRNIGLLLDAGDDIVGSPDGVAVVRPKAEHRKEYPWGWVYASLRSEACRLQFWTESGGTSYGKLTREQIRDVLLPVPSLDERHRDHKAVESWANRMEAAATDWRGIGTEADRRPILNSPLFGLESDDEETEMEMETS